MKILFIIQIIIISMCFRLAYFFRDTFKTGTACCNLLITIGKILIGILCIAGIYFGFMGVGKILYLIVEAICNGSSSCDNFLRDKNKLFTWVPVQGFLVLGMIFVSCIIIGLIGWGLNAIFNKPCREMAESWHRSKHPNYENAENPTRENDENNIQLEVRIEDD